MNAQTQVARGVAVAMLAGPWTSAGLSQRVAVALGARRPTTWVRALTAAALDAYRDAPSDRPLELAGYLQTLAVWDRGWQRRRRPRVVHWEPLPTVMVRRPWPVTPLDDLGDLMRLLDVDSGELAWFADVRSMERDCAPPLRHYRWRTLPKRDGVRLVAAPKPRLKEIQRRLLRHAIAPIPFHPAAHGGVPGCSVRTAVEPHAGSIVVIRLDLEAFYDSISAGRVWGVLCRAGYPEPVAHAITGLVTTVAPLPVWRSLPVPRDSEQHRRRGERLARPHLPHGAPTSSALANLAAFALDRRLAGLATRFGARYTRYVDDLTFSGGPSLRTARSRFVELVDEIVRDEGFRVNERKTVILGDAGRQHVLGAVINDHPTLTRRERDNLRALLHNCVEHGWQSQVRGQPEFRSWLLGRVSWANSLDPVLGGRLRAQFGLIDWA